MREDWCVEGLEEDMEEDVGAGGSGLEAWNSPEFLQLSRRQQNIEIFKVVSGLVVSLGAEITSSRTRVEDLLRRLENAENDCSLAGDGGGHQPFAYSGHQTGNGMVGVGHLAAVTGGRPQLNPTNQGQFEFPSLRSEYENSSVSHPNAQGWLFSPRSASPCELPEEPDIPAIAKARKANPKVILNVGGLKHEVMWRMLEKRPLTRLGMLSKARTHQEILNLCDAYSLQDNEFYFDRDPATFNCVLNFYRTERLHIIDEVCILDFADDLEFWMIKELNLEICCLDKFNARREHILQEVEKEKATQGEDEVEEDFGDGYFAQYQKALWDLFEKPQSSLCAKLISLLSIGLVLVSTVGMCLNTFDWMQAQDIHGQPVDNPKLALIEAVCISYFSIEYLLRFAGAPKKWDFLKGTMNVIDCMAIAPYYLTLFFMPQPEMGPIDPAIPTGPGVTTEEPQQEGGFGDVGRIMQVFRIARIMRIFKLARRSVGLQSIAHTVKTSWKDLGLLFLLVGMGMLVFGSLEYYIENEEDETGFTSIPQGMWYAVQTLTSLGYGDFTPQTFLGKVVGSFCGVCGVLVMALPIPIVVDNFADYYSEQKKLEAKELRREAQAKQTEFDVAAKKVAENGLVKTLASKPGAFSTPPMSPPDGVSRFRLNGTVENKF